jgi:thiol-disulfide isomerase/thioredoxin
MASNRIKDEPVANVRTIAPGERRFAPMFPASAHDRAEFRLSDYGGSVVLLNFWATWCKPCLDEIPWFNEFNRKYSNRGLRVIGISVDDGGWKTVEPFLKDHRVEFRVAVAEEDLRDQYGIRKLPTTLLLDRKGKIAAIATGLQSRRVYEKMLLSALKEEPIMTR